MKSLSKVEYSWWLRFLLWFRPATVGIDTETVSLDWKPRVYYVTTKQLFGTTYVVDAGVIEMNVENLFGREISV